jgi:hypothetical protein
MKFAASLTLAFLTSLPVSVIGNGASPEPEIMAQTCSRSEIKMLNQTFQTKTSTPERSFTEIMRSVNPVILRDALRKSCDTNFWEDKKPLYQAMNTDAGLKNSPS